MDASYLEMTLSSLGSSEASIGLVGIHQGFLIVLEYGIGFFNWARHISMLLPSEHDLVCGFIRGLALPLFLASKHLIIARSSFSQVVYHVRAIEKVVLGLIEKVVKGHIISIVLLTFYLGVRILPVEVSFT